MENENQRHKKDYLLPASILLSVLILGGALIYTVREAPASQQDGADSQVNQQPQRSGGCGV